MPAPEYIGNSARRPMVFHMRARGLDGHAVDPRRALVALHSRQRFFEIVPLDNGFHARSGQGRRAFDCDVRPIGSDPSGADASGFTRRFHAESRPELGFRPPGQCESPALLTLSTVRASGRYADLLCPLLTSAPRSRALRRALSPDSRTRTRTSRGKFGRLPRTPAEFTTPVLDDCGLRGHTPARPAG
jgi:hypothetical protein